MLRCHEVDPAFSELGTRRGTPWAQSYGGGPIGLGPAPSLPGGPAYLGGQSIAPRTGSTRTPATGGAKIEGDETPTNILGIIGRVDGNPGGKNKGRKGGGSETAGGDPPSPDSRGRGGG
jgi:hypothetical protein